MNQATNTDLRGDLRRAIAASGMNRFEISRRSGVGYAAIHGLVAGTRDLTLDTASKVIEALALRIELRPTARKRKGG